MLLNKILVSIAINHVMSANMFNILQNTIIKFCTIINKNRDVTKPVNGKPELLLQDNAVC